MRQIQHGSVVILGLLAVGVSSQAQAQMMGPYQPPISPYINILRGGAPPAVNFFNIVQPQLQFNAALGQLQMQQNAMGESLAGGNIYGTTTGHPIMFGNYSHYYPMQRMGMGGMGMGGMGMGGMRMAGMGMGSMGMGSMGMGMGGMGMGGMGMGGMGMGGMGMGGMGMGGMGMGGMGMGGMGRMGGR